MCKSESIKVKKEGVSANVNVVSFVDETGYNCVYCPSLEMIGAGRTEKEAEDSFRIVFEEQMRYMIENDTLNKELSRLGWTKRPRSIVPPKMTVLVSHNKTLRSIFNQHDFSKFNCAHSFAL